MFAQVVERFYKKSRTKKTINHFHTFITGGGRVGKSNLIKTIHMSQSKVLIYKGGDAEKPRILLVAPTVVAVVHISGTTIHCGLQIDIGGEIFPLNHVNQLF